MLALSNSQVDQEDQCAFRLHITWIRGAQDNTSYSCAGIKYGLIRHTLQVISGMKIEVMGTGTEPWQLSEYGMSMGRWR